MNESDRVPQRFKLIKRKSIKAKSYLRRLKYSTS